MFSTKGNLNLHWLQFIHKYKKQLSAIRKSAGYLQPKNILDLELEPNGRIFIIFA